MSKSIQDIWILKDNGKIIFNRVFDEKLNNSLFGNLVTAMDSFAKELEEGDLSNFELRDKRFTIKKEKKLLFIVNTSKKADNKKAKRDLEMISEKFLQSYPKDIANFEEEIGDLLENPMKAFWNGF